MVEKDRVKGKVESIAVRPRRPFADWTGDTKSQVDAEGPQANGKSEKAWGNVKDEDQDAKDDGQREIDESKAIHPVTGSGKMPS